MNEVMALDIGTGTVIGFIGRKEGDRLTLIARSESLYERRAIEEGRVVDVNSATETVRKVVEDLWSSAKTTVNVAHYAVAGRGLKIKEVAAKLDFGQQMEFGPDEIRKLYRRQRPMTDDFVVIDEEVVERRIDGEEVLNFNAQHGRKLEIKWLLTALHLDEIRNKRKIIEKAGLIPGQLVLEPRAAVQAAFPGHEFRPRVGVIDFGAGTIDAALLEEGKIRDFSTLFGSGDRLTRRLEEILLVDFKQAEDIKQTLAYRDQVTLENLAGEQKTVIASDLADWLSPLIEAELAPLREWFADRLPRLLFLAGGGSQFPFLPQLVANVLKIDENCIIANSPRLREQVNDPRGLLNSPADFTAYGLLLSAANNKGRYDLNVEVNGEERNRLVRGSKYTVADLLADMGYRSYRPAPEAVKMVCIDDKWETRKQSGRLEPMVEVDGEPVAGEYCLRSGDIVKITAADKPKPVKVLAGDFLPEDRLHIEYAGKEFYLSPRLIAEDGRTIYPGDDLHDGGEYETLLLYNRSEVVDFLIGKGIDLPSELLWLKNKQYTEDHEFSVGDSLVLEPAVDPDNYGLGRLYHPPAPADRALLQSLN